MRRLFASLMLPFAFLAVAACSQEQEDGYDPSAQLETLAEIGIDTDTGFLTDEEREVVNLLMRASDLMSEIYKRQRLPDYDEVRSEVADSGDDLMLTLFDRNFGPWDEMAELHPFWGDAPMPEGAGFFPADMTREEFNAYLEAHPDEAETLNSPYTVVRRDGDALVAIPYSVEYAEWLEPAAQLLEQAADLTSNASLENFLRLRATSFRTDDYFESELAWMELDGTPIEIAIGPYEVYTDRLMGTKTAFESYLTLKDPEESAALAHYKALLRDMEGNLPIPDEHKNFQRDFNSPIVVANQIRGGGDNVPGVQTIAFNLPNDERVRETRGAKKVILANVLGAKYEIILDPIGRLVLAEQQAALVSRKYMQLFTLFHELSHSLGPGTIVVDGRETTVNEELRDRYTALEESKADVMGMWNILYMMETGELPIAEKPELFSTYLAGLFRSMRFGVISSHGQGAALQYGYLLDRGAFAFDEATGLYVIDEARMESAIAELLHDQLMLQATGDYDGTIAFFEQWAHLDEHAENFIAQMDSIPIDILPLYPSSL